MTKLFKRSLVIFSLILGAVMVGGSTANASARVIHHPVRTTRVHHVKSHWTLKYVPKRFRGIWYFYRGHNVFNMMKVNRYGYTNMFYSRRHHKYYSYPSYIKPENDSANAKLPSWKVLRANNNAFSATNTKHHGHKWLVTGGWYGAGGDEYRVTKLGHHRKQLTETSGAGFWSPARAYNSRTLARQNYRK